MSRALPPGLARSLPAPTRAMPTPPLASRLMLPNLPPGCLFHVMSEAGRESYEEHDVFERQLRNAAVDSLNEANGHKKSVTRSHSFPTRSKMVIAGKPMGFALVVGGDWRRGKFNKEIAKGLARVPSIKDQPVKTRAHLVVKLLRRRGRAPRRKRRNHNTALCTAPPWGA